MKKAKRLILLLAILAAILSGCVQTPAATATPMPTPAKTATPSPSPTDSPTPTVEPTATPEPVLAYTYDPYALQSDAKAHMGDTYKEYKALVDAVTARQEVIPFTSAETMDAALWCLYSGSYLRSFITADYNMDKKSNELKLQYVYSTDEHASRVAAYIERVTFAIVSSVKPQYNDLERALALYRFTAQNIVYQNGDDVSPYHALMDGVGICQSFDGVYSSLLLQIGIDNLSCSSFMIDDQAHVWTMLQLDGQRFHMDTTFENGTNGGSGLMYFGMYDVRRADTGAVAGTFKTGVNEWCIDAAACPDYRFSCFGAVERWEQDEEAHRIALYYTGETEPTYFDTVTYQMIADDDEPTYEGE